MPQFVRRSTALADVTFAQALHSETHTPTEGAEYKCPTDESPCDRHCRHSGYRGGYCGGTLKTSCRCY